MAAAGGQPASVAPRPAAGPWAAAAAALDARIYALERLLVTACLLAMTTTVTLDIVHRSFSSPRSQIADKLAALWGWIAGPPPPAVTQALHQAVAPAVLAALAFACGWGAFAAARQHAGRPAPRALGAAAGLGAVAGGWALVQLVVHVPSRWVCLGIVVAGCCGYAGRAARRRAPGAVLMALAVGALGGWGCTQLPPDYIWSRELSLVLLTWVAFLGGSMATRDNAHIVVGALARAVPAPLRPWSRALGLLVTTAACAWLTALAVEHIFGPRGDWFSGERRPATGLPAWTITMAALVAFALMTLRFGARALEAFLHPRPPEEKALL
ncbi:MAG: hypothetical protein KatS3mg102_1336 [Planctomycetota bacterium]|nr:MAG: hypothetical protein KatS3mg102_1336 [Planctomycetota bacterium]